MSTQDAVPATERTPTYLVPSLLLTAAIKAVSLLLLLSVSPKLTMSTDTFIFFSVFASCNDATDTPTCSDQRAHSARSAAPAPGHGSNVHLDEILLRILHRTTYKCHNARPLVLVHTVLQQQLWAHAASRQAAVGTTIPRHVAGRLHVRWIVPCIAPAFRRS